MNITLRRAAIWLTVVFLLSLAANLVILGLLNHAMTDIQSEAILGTVLKVHAVPLGALLAGIFSRQKNGSHVTLAALITAVVVSILWVVIVTFSWWGFPDRIQAPDVNNRYLNYSSDVAFLLVAMIGYFTGKASASDS